MVSNDSLAEVSLFVKPDLSVIYTLNYTGSYSDDIIILARNREEAQLYIRHLLNVLKEKKLSTNDEKTCLINPGEATAMLGFRIEGRKIDISPHSLEKLKRRIRVHAGRLLKLKKEQSLTDEDCGKKMIQYCNRLFFGGEKSTELVWSKWLFPVINETASLKELDHYVQNAIRYCMCGSMSKKRYRITYRALQNLGYRNLLHAYYHFQIPGS